MDRRVAWLDTAKGLGIVLVVYGHAYRGLATVGIEAPDSPLRVVDYAIYSFHMPLFLFLAGLCAGPSLAKGTKRFWTAKLLLLLYPYLLWSMLQGTMQIAFSRFANNHPSIETLLGILWWPIEQFWFLYALLWCHAAFTVLRRLSYGPLLAMAASLLVSTFYAAPGTVSTVIWAFFYYALGIVLGRHVQGLGRSSWILVLGLWGVFAIIVSGALVTGMRDAAALPAALCGIAATIALSQRLGERSGALRLLGYLSMSIYVMHVLATAAARTVMLKALHIESVPVQLLLGTAAGLALPVAAHILLSRTGLLPWLGLSNALSWPQRRRSPAAAPG